MFLVRATIRPVATHVEVSAPGGSYSFGPTDLPWAQAQAHAAPHWAFGNLLLLLALVGGLVLLSWALSGGNRGQHDADDELWRDERTHRGSAGRWAVGIVFCLTVIGLFWARTATSVKMARVQSQAAVEAEEHHRLEQIKRQSAELGTRAKQAAIQTRQNIQEIMDNFDKPRIELNSTTEAPPPPAAGDQQLSAEEVYDATEGDGPTARPRRKASNRKPRAGRRSRRQGPTLAPPTSSKTQMRQTPR